MPVFCRDLSIQVARWSALVGGLVYGYVHHNSLTALEHGRAEQKKIEHRDELIAKAKAEWVKINTPSGGKAALTLPFDLTITCGASDAIAIEQLILR